jgi:hypothetical protein
MTREFFLTHSAPYLNEDGCDLIWRDAGKFLADEAENEHTALGLREAAKSTALKFPELANRAAA